MALKKKEQKTDKKVVLEIYSSPILEDCERVAFEAGIKGFPVGIKAIEGGVGKVRTNLMPLSEAEAMRDKLETEGYDVMILL